MTGVYGSAQKQFEMSRTNILWKNLQASLCLLLFIRFIRVLGSIPETFRIDTQVLRYLTLIGFSVKRKVHN